MAKKAKTKIKRVKSPAELAAERVREKAIVIGVPDAQIARGEHVEADVKLDPGEVATTYRTLKNMGADRVTQLYKRGVIDRDLHAACRCYADWWERSGLGGGAIALYGERVSAEPAYGHMARTEAQVEARAQYRWARTLIPGDVLKLFEAVVLSEMQIRDAARAVRCRYANATAAFRRGALALHGAIAHLLTIEPGEPT